MSEKEFRLNPALRTHLTDGSGEVFSGEADDETDPRDATGERLAFNDRPTVRRRAAEMKVCRGCRRMFGVSEKGESFRVRASGEVILLHQGSIECALKAIRHSPRIRPSAAEAKQLVARLLEPVKE